MTGDSLGTPRGRTRRADAELNRAKVLAAAARLFAERGLDVSLNEVSRHAGVGIATLLRNFDDRDELIAEVFTARVREYADAAEAAVAVPEPWAGFCGYVQLVCRLQVEDRGFAAVLTTTFPAREALEAERRRALRGFTRLVRRAKAAGSLRADFSAHDLPLILLANAGIVSRTGPVAARASRRLVALVLHACAAQPEWGLLPSGPAPRDLLRALQEGH